MPNNFSPDEDPRTRDPSEPLLVHTDGPVRPLANRDARIENNIPLRLRQILKRSPLRDVDQSITPLIRRESRIKRNSRSDVSISHVASGVIRTLIALKPERRSIEDRVVGEVEARAFVVVDGRTVGRAEDPVLGNGRVWTGG